MTLRQVGASLALMVALVSAGSAQRGAADDKQFQAALHKEMIDGDLKGAIEEYRKISLRPGVAREVAATSLLHMAACYEKLGDAEGRKIYERIARDYSDQKDAADAARARLGASAATEPPRGITLRKVWDGRASGLTAAVLTTVSQDGRRLSYVPWMSSNVNVHDLVTGLDRPAAESFGGPSIISKDGRQVAYEWYGGQRTELRLANVQEASGAFRRLHESADISDFNPMDFSPDGTSIVVVLLRTDRTNQIGLINVADGALRVLKSLEWRFPIKVFFSPDGKNLLFDLPAGDSNDQRDVFVLAADGSRETPVVVHPSNDIAMGWSPDGNYLLFASDRRGGAMGLWSQAFAQGKPQGTPELVKESIGSSWSLGISKSGALYLGTAAGDRDIGVATIDLATGKQITPAVRPIQTFIGTNLQPAWSPDGKSLAYVSLRAYNPMSGIPRILAIRSVDTGEERVLRPKLNYWNQMSWAPDGRAFVAGGWDLKQREGIFRIDAQTGEVSPIVLVPEDHANSYPQWSSDGKRIYYRRRLRTDAETEVAFVERNLASGAEREVARGDFGSISLSPDGRWIAAGKTDRSTGTTAVVIIPVDGGEMREVLRGSQDQPILAGFNGMPWTPDGTGVLVRRRSSGDRRASNTALWLVPIADALPRKLDIDTSRWATGNIGSISLSPDGRQIAFLSGQVNSEVWALENFLPALDAKK